jgi:hypothetical protein
MAAGRAASTRSAASASIPGRTWLYRSSVIPILECPSRSLATFGWTPWLSKWVAWACLKLWNRIRGREVPSSLRNQSWVIVSGSNGVPSASATTNVSSERRTRTLRSSSARRGRWALCVQFLHKAGRQGQCATLAVLGRLVADLCAYLFGSFKNGKLGRWKD